jgi:hypothetical protein
MFAGMPVHETCGGRRRVPGDIMSRVPERKKEWS